ncbi:dynein regulatory complex protein 12 [Pluvialis apricaria]
MVAGSTGASRTAILAEAQQLHVSGSRFLEKERRFPLGQATRVAVWVTYQEARCPHGSPVHLWLAVPWRDVTWQAKADNEGLRWRLWDLEKALEQAQEDKRDIHEEMTRQYQELQKQTAAHRQRLEAKVKSLQEQLATRLQESQQTQETAAQALAEKDKTIAQLQGKLDVMEREYEKILHGSLDLVLAKMAEASRRWEEVGTTIAVEHKERLREFGLNPLEI